MRDRKPYILAIETSCDDTAVSILRGSSVLSHLVSSQWDHAQYGGIIPEVASRRHIENLLPVVHQCLKSAQLQLGDLDAIAYTRGPGLLGSLIVGSTFAKTLGQALGLPVMGVHHMKAHVLSNMIETPRPSFPFLCLTVSGGHTELVLVEAPMDMHILGRTIDDAAGEAFDKMGKMLGLPYPAGPQIDRLAKEGVAIYEFPEPQIDGLDFSFSGLKTSFMRFLKKELARNPDFIQQELHNLCASIQQRIVSILLHKLEKAASREGISNIAMAGGVSANSALREGVEALGQMQKWNVYYPRLEYCTDNASMIGMVASYMYDQKIWDELSSTPLPRWEIQDQ